MSVYIESKEHFIINNLVEENEDNYAECDYWKSNVRELIRDKLSMLGAVMLSGIGKIDALKVSANGKVYSFSGSIVTEKYDEIVRAVKSAQNLDVVIDYSFWEYVSFIPGEYLDCLGSMGYFKKIEQENMKDIFYSCWRLEDCGDYNGLLFAYGEKNGKYYHGEVKAQKIDRFPEGNWYADTDICADGVTVTGETLEQIKKVIRKIEEYTANPKSDKEPYDMCDYGLSYIMNNAELKNEKEFSELHALLKELRTLAGDVVIPVGMYIDRTGDEVRQLCIEYDQNMNPTFTYEAVT